MIGWMSGSVKSYKIGRRLTVRTVHMSHKELGNLANLDAGHVELVELEDELASGALSTVYH